jgi:hypothetical protein
MFSGQSKNHHATTYTLGLRAFIHRHHTTFSLSHTTHPPVNRLFRPHRFRLFLRRTHLLLDGSGLLLLFDVIIRLSLLFSAGQGYVRWILLCGQLLACKNFEEVIGMASS